MSKLKSWTTAVLILLLIGLTVWYVGQNNHPFNKVDTFVYNEQGNLYWFEITGKQSSIEGTFHQRSISEEPGKVPVLDEKKYALTGKTTEKGYAFQISDDKEKKQFDAKFSGSNLLLVQEHGKKAVRTFHAAKAGELEQYAKGLQQNLQTAIDQSEEKEKKRLQTFFSNLNSTYGFLHISESDKYLLFLQIDEALHQGELQGSLVVVTDTGKANKPYEEERYGLHGITDGLMVEFFTTVEGKETNMKGHFHKDAGSLALSFWKTEQQLTFDAVTEKEFEKRYENFKAESSVEKPKK